MKRNAEDTKRQFPQAANRDPPPNALLGSNFRSASWIAAAPSLAPLTLLPYLPSRAKDQ